ncbi:MAG: aminotransferase class III-fold pyridoxal phosphate-dependent enzyme [Thermoleophilia bacterium]|jgi:glutamate-1-semialdehyde aminotransferase|nr:aminotransferase class III-fold pyridoxal phosphate-dependent enzyme [Thermoleophilia bacterium]
MKKPVESAPKLELSKSMSMLEDAYRLTPGGVGGIRRPYNFVVGEYPVFITHGKGGHIFDVDGNEYIDMLCAYGPIILGYVEPEINEAVKARMDQGFCFSLVQPVQNELEERLADVLPCGEQTIIVKTGSDATNAAVRAARAYTGRDKIARCGYHGWGDWCVEVRGGIPQAVQDLTKEFVYGDIADLERVFAENPGEIATVIITPVGHPMALPIIPPPEGYLEKVKEVAHDNGAVLIFDEIRTGFRVAMGGAQQRYGVTPDLTTVGKAMANGYPIAAVVGKREVLSMYEKVAFLSSTFFPNSLEMVAAMKCMDILEREDVQNVIWERGTRFLERLGEIVDASGVPVTKSGIPPMPFLTFDKVDDRYKERRTEFYTQCIRRGLFVQPYHHWYIAYRHTEEDLARALEVVEESLAYVAQEYPYGA